MLFTNLTGRNEIGANCYLVEGERRRLLLDCGSHPRIEGLGGLPRLELLGGRAPDAVIISHGHLDHLGSLPVLDERCPGSAVFMSHGTAAIADRALHNSASVMIRQRAELDLPEYPLFTHGQVDRLMERVRVLPVGRSVEVAGLEVALHEAGHVQGAVGVWVEMDGKSVFYTGDVKFSGMRITRAAQFPDRRRMPWSSSARVATRLPSRTSPGMARRSVLPAGSAKCTRRAGACSSRALPLGRRRS